MVSGSRQLLFDSLIGARADIEAGAGGREGNLRQWFGWIGRRSGRFVNEHGGCKAGEAAMVEMGSAPVIAFAGGVVLFFRV
jgi:hypothetical protein